jgi:uncharacterized membrane protein YgdD (TMEM256/DUF423 family)
MPLIFGALGALLSVALGAFAAHALQARLDPGSLATFKTGVEYQFYHSLGLLLIAQFTRISPASSPLLWSGRLMGLGILLFSGSLYLLALTDTSWPGPVTPLGGLCFLAAWFCLAIHGWKSGRELS